MTSARTWDHDGLVSLAGWHIANADVGAIRDTFGLLCIAAGMASGPEATAAWDEAWEKYLADVSVPKEHQ